MSGTGGEGALTSGLSPFLENQVAAARGSWGRSSRFPVDLELPSRTLKPEVVPGGGRGGWSGPWHNSMVSWSRFSCPSVGLPAWKQDGRALARPGGQWAWTREQPFTACRRQALLPLSRRGGNSGPDSCTWPQSPAERWQPQDLRIPVCWRSQVGTQEALGERSGHISPSPRD